MNLFAEMAFPWRRGVGGCRTSFPDTIYLPLRGDGLLVLTPALSSKEREKKRTTVHEHNAPLEVVGSPAEPFHQRDPAPQERRPTEV